MPLTFLVGGARSGKSRLAVRVAEATERPLLFVATAEPRDAEMEERIRRHRAGRSTAWATVEAPVDLEAALSAAPPEGCVLVDCLSLWVSNLMERGFSDDEIACRAHVAAADAADRAAPTVAVSNEVGSGVVPDNVLARRYRDVLGTVNALWAEMAERAALVVAGRPLRLDRPDAFLEDEHG